MRSLFRGSRARPLARSAWLPCCKEGGLREPLSGKVDEPDAVVDVAEQLPQGRLVRVLNDGRHELAPGLSVEAFPIEKPRPHDRERTAPIAAGGRRVEV